MTVRGPKPRCKCLHFHVIKIQIIIFSVLLWLDIQLVFLLLQMYIAKRLFQVCAARSYSLFLLTTNSTYIISCVLYMYMYTHTFDTHYLIWYCSLYFTVDDSFSFLPWCLSPQLTWFSSLNPWFSSFSRYFSLFTVYILKLICSHFLTVTWSAEHTLLSEVALRSQDNPW